MQPFEFAVDLPRRTLCLTLRGKWDEATFDQFAADYARALTLLRNHGGCRHALVDGRDFAVQSNAISARFRELIASMAPIAAERTATIVPGEPDRAQAERAGASINARIFTDREAAEAWLHDADAATPSKA